MESGALSTAEFREFGREVVLFCHITSHVEGEKYPGLLGEKGGTGFPYLVAMDAGGNVLAKHSGPRTVEGFRETMRKGAEFEALMAKEDPTPRERFELFKARLDLRHFDLPQAKAEAAKLEGLSDAERAEVDAALVSLEIQQHAPASREDLAASGKVFAAMYAAGKRPAAGRESEMFYICILEHAFAEKDAALFKGALGELEKQFAGNPRAKGFLDQQAKRLAEIEAGGTK